MSPYILRSNKRAKHIRITIRPDGTVIVTKPTRVSIAVAEHFIQTKSSWVIEKVNQIKKNPVVTHTKGEMAELKKKAQIIAEEKIKYFNQFYNFTYNTVRIKNQKTRWGSCSKKGNLNFNYKLAILPEKLANYLVVHELCHLGEFNHSQKFWNLVGKVIPDYKVLRAELQTIKL
ncbi:MAG: SprT family zinc-dependent metalloprotease [Patescibacteria group bacterium]